MLDDEGGSCLWLAEYFTPTDRLMHRIERVLALETTEFQQMQVVVSASFGKALILDGTWQSATADEFIYHETLVHPAMLGARTPPKTVLILGGGEGATAREVLRWRCVQRCVMVDIDGQVVEACRRHLPEMHGGAFDDPRLEVVIGDARAFVASSTERWDVIISDLSDPIEHGPSFQFFTREYFAQVRDLLTDGGVFALQAGPASEVDHGIFVRLLATVRAELPHAEPMRATVPSFATQWGVIVAARHALGSLDEPKAIDGSLHEHVRGPMRFIDGPNLRAIRTMPPAFRARLAQDVEPYTLADPPKFSDARGIAAN